MIEMGLTISKTVCNSIMKNPVMQRQVIPAAAVAAYQHLIPIIQKVSGYEADGATRESKPAIFKNEDNIQNKNTMDNRMADSPLHQACRGGNLFITQELLKNGNKVNIINLAGDTPLHLAAEAHQPRICAELLKYGANLVAKNLNGEYPEDRINGHKQTEDFFFYARLYFQIKNAYTGGIHQNETIRLKQTLFDAIKNELPHADMVSLTKSIQLEELLWKPGADMLDVMGHMRVALNKLEANEFIWLSNGGIPGHAINLLIRDMPDNRLEFVVANRSLGLAYHEKDVLGRVYPKVFRFDPSTVMEPEKARKEFEQRLSSRIGMIYEIKKENKWCDIHEYYYRLKDLINSPGVSEITSEGNPVTIQKSDNCSTTSMMTTLSYLYTTPTSKEFYKTLRSEYTQYLIKNILNTVPDLIPEDLKMMVEKARNYNDPENTNLVATIQLKKAMQTDRQFKYRVEKYQRAIENFEFTRSKWDEDAIINPPSDDRKFERDLIDKIINSCYQKQEELRKFI